MIESTKLYTVNDIIDMKVITRKIVVPDLSDGVRRDIQRQLILHDIKNEKLLAVKLSSGQYVVQGSDLITYISNYGNHTNIILKGTGTKTVTGRKGKRN